MRTGAPNTLEAEAQTPPLWRLNLRPRPGLRKGLAQIPNIPSFSLTLCWQIWPILGLEQRLGFGGKKMNPHLLRGPRETQRYWLNVMRCWLHVMRHRPAAMVQLGCQQPWASEAVMEAMEAGSLPETGKSGHLHPRGLVGGSSCCPFPSSVVLFLLFLPPILGELLPHVPHNL